MKRAVHWKILFACAAFFTAALIGMVWLEGQDREIIPVSTIAFISGWLTRSTVRGSE
jgi:hypothetical protein